MSKYRHLKKKLQYARCLWLADNLGCVKRTHLMDYFKKHPHDFAYVKHLCKKQKYNPFYVQSVSNDIKTNYHHPDYSEEQSKRVVKQIEETYFIPYIEMKKKHINLGVGLSQFYRFDEDYDWIKTPNGKCFGLLKKNIGENK